MSQENVATIERAYAALNRGDTPTLLGLCHPDVVLDNSNATTPPSTRVMRGSSSSSLFGREWESQRFELQEALPVGDDRVLAPGADCQHRAGTAWRRSPTARASTP